MEEKKEIFTEEIIFKTTITDELENCKRAAIKNILNVLEFVVPKDRYHDIRKVVLDELNDYNRKTCGILSKVIDSVQ